MVNGTWQLAYNVRNTIIIVAGSVFIAICEFMAFGGALKQRLRTGDNVAVFHLDDIHDM